MCTQQLSDLIRLIRTIRVKTYFFRIIQAFHNRKLEMEQPLSSTTRAAAESLSSKELKVVRSIFIAAAVGTTILGFFDNSESLLTPWDEWWIPFNSLMYFFSGLILFFRPRKQIFALLLSLIPTSIYQQGVLFWAIHFPNEVSYYSAASSGPFFPIVYLAVFITLPRHALLLSCMHCGALFLQGIGNNLYYWLLPDISRQTTADHLFTAVLCSHPAYIVALRYIVTLREHVLKTQQDAFDSKTHFLGMLSHEIKNFLQGMLSSVDLLTLKAKTIEDRKQLESIAGQTEQLNTYLSDVLTLNRLENPSLTVKPTPTNLSQLLHEVHATWVTRAQKRNLELNLSIPQEFEGLTVSTDSIRLRQVMDNLISNAVKYTPSGSITIDAFLEDSPSAYAVIDVKDTGIGISKNDQKSVFEQYVRLRRANEICSEGSGLGLAIVTRILSMLGGSISLESEPDKGSTFRVRIPRA